MNLIVPGDEGVTPLVGDITGKPVVIAFQHLNRRYQMPRFQIFMPTGGFGCQEGSLGSKVYGRSMADNEDSQFRREHFIGFASSELVQRAMLDTTPVPGIDLSLREYMLVSRDGRTERGDTIEQARQRLRKVTKAHVVSAWEIHPESHLTEWGAVSFPEGAPPVEVPIKKGRIWTAAH